MAGTSKDGDAVVLLQDCSQMLQKQRRKAKAPTSRSFVDTGSSDTEEEADPRMEYGAEKYVKTTEVQPAERITADLWNAMITCPVLSQLSEKAKKKIREELKCIEKKHAKKLKKANKTASTEKNQIWADTIGTINARTEALQKELADIKNSIANSHIQTKEVLLQLATSNQQQDLKESIQELTEKCEGIKEAPEEAPRSYAAAAMSKRTVLIKAQEAAKAQELMKALGEKECPGGITIEKIRRVNRNVEIVCASEQESNMLQEHLAGQVPDEVPIEGKRPPSSRLILFNVPETCTEEQLGTAICRITRIAGQPSILRKMAARREASEHWVLELPREQGEALLSRGSLFLGFRRINLRKFFTIRRCHRCQRIGVHTAANCPNQAYCEQCAGNHSIQQCPKKKTCCVNCKKANSEDYAKNPKTKTLRDTSHPASDPSCPAYRQAIRELSQR